MNKLATKLVGNIQGIHSVVIVDLGDGFKKIKGKSMVFRHIRGEGRPPRVVKTVFFQRACRIILGTTNYVLHFIWGASEI